MRHFQYAYAVAAFFVLVFPWCWERIIDLIEFIECDIWNGFTHGKDEKFFFLLFLMKFQTKNERRTLWVDRLTMIFLFRVTLRNERKTNILIWIYEQQQELHHILKTHTENKPDEHVHIWKQKISLLFYKIASLRSGHVLVCINIENSISSSLQRFFF